MKWSVSVGRSTVVIPQCTNTLWSMKYLRFVLNVLSFLSTPSDLTSDPQPSWSNLWPPALPVWPLTSEYEAVQEVAAAGPADLAPPLSVSALSLPGPQILLTPSVQIWVRTHQDRNPPPGVCSGGIPEICWSVRERLEEEEEDYWVQVQV